MAGTFVQDALAPNLLTGATLDADGTTNGDVWNAEWPQLVTFVFTPVDPNAADDATIQITIQGCETEDFTTADVVTFAAFPVIAEAAMNTDSANWPYELTTRVTTKFVRASVTVIDGTNGDYAGATLIPSMDHLHRTAVNSAAPLA